jgi:hypothetical protein
MRRERDAAASLEQDPPNSQQRVKARKFSGSNQVSSMHMYVYIFVDIIIQNIDILMLLWTSTQQMIGVVASMYVNPFLKIEIFIHIFIYIYICIYIYVYICMNIYLYVHV